MDPYENINVSEVEIHYKKKQPPEHQVISPADSFRVFRSIYDMNRIEHKEFVYAMYLNAKSKVLGVILISEGCIDSAPMDVRLIFQAALKLNAISVILCHNHPSGDVNPSERDRLMTKRAVEAGNILQIKVSDHLIITQDKYFSFSDDGII